MTTNEIRNIVKNSATRSFIEAMPEALMLTDKDYVFVTPVEVEGIGTVWAKFTLTTCQWMDTKTKEAFDPDNEAADPMDRLEGIIEAQDAKRLEAEAKKAAKANKDAE